MVIGDYRNEAMQIASEELSKQTAHFQVPCQDRQGISV